MFQRLKNNVALVRAVSEQPERGQSEGVRGVVGKVETAFQGILFSVRVEEPALGRLD